MMTDVTCNGVVASWVVGACGERARHAGDSRKECNDDDDTAKHILNTVPHCRYSE